MDKTMWLWRQQAYGRRPARWDVVALCIIAGVITLTSLYFLETSQHSRWQTQHPSDLFDLNTTHILAQCTALKLPAGPSPDFHSRSVSDRFVQGTRPTLIKNATIWTGKKGGEEILHGDILLDHGLVKAVGKIPPSLLGNGIVEVDAEEAWVTPGLIDLHSHMGVFSVPVLSGALDVGSQKSPVNPSLRSIDGLNTHDEAYRLTIAGGVTSGQVLPGSGNNIGGQAFFVKYRKTSEHSPTAMLIEPPHTLNGSHPVDPLERPRWRHMKQACGENLRRWGNRMDAAWAFREAYDEARKIRDAQDEFCRKAERGDWETLHRRGALFEGDTGRGFPESLKWEMLVDVLRGRVKISNHCYESVDLDMIVRLTNEFKFHIASFHHASETWLVPDVLKRMWGGPPAAAIFASNFRYKREAYRGSEFAPRVLGSNDIPVVLKSDHPVLNSRHLLHEAQQAHYYGLPANLALASVTSTPATAGGMSHRIGILQPGADADIVLWDSHPLQLGATPKQVWIDGIKQLENPAVTEKGPKLQKAPVTPNFDREAQEAVDWEGLPPLEARKEAKKVVFGNVSEVWTKDGGAENGLDVKELGEVGVSGKTVVVEDGGIVCIGDYNDCAEGLDGSYEEVDLKGGTIFPGLISYGAPLGLEEITQEVSTGDGPRPNPAISDGPSLLGGKTATLRAVDALQFGLRDPLLAYKSGVTLALTSLGTESLFAGPSNTFNGLSVLFNPGAASALEPHAIVKRHAALHVTISHAKGGRGPAEWPSVSAQIGALRGLLTGEVGEGDTAKWFGKAAKGEIPLIIDVTSADIMVVLLALKSEVEQHTNSTMRMSFSRATEAHLIAREIAEAGVGVILRNSRPFPISWSERRIAPGPPLEADSQIVKLLRQNVTVGIGVVESWSARNTRFDVGWAYLEANGQISRSQALSLATTNLEHLFAVAQEGGDLVAYSGGTPFDFESKVEAVISRERKTVELF